MSGKKVRRDEHSGAEIEGDAKLTLPNGETIDLPYLKVLQCREDWDKLIMHLTLT